jgi:hypothetical protein
MSVEAYEVRPRKDHRGVDLISDALPFGRLWYGEPNAISNAIGYAEHRSRSHGAVIRIFDGAGNVIETHSGRRPYGTNCQVSFSGVSLSCPPKTITRPNAGK